MIVFFKAGKAENKDEVAATNIMRARLSNDVSKKKMSFKGLDVFD